MKRRPSQNGPWRNKRSSSHITECVISDTHVPYHDPEALELAFRIMKHIQPQIVTHLGDGPDFVQVSWFNKDPRRLDQLNKDRNLFEKVVLKPIRREHGDAECFYFEGNHDLRLYYHLCRYAPALVGTPEVDLENFLKLKQYGFKFIRRTPSSDFDFDKHVFIPPESFQRNHLYYLHGHELRTVYTTINIAASIYRKTASNVIVGHFHRLQSHSQPALDGKLKGVWTNPCLCHMRPDFDAHPLWSQGLTAIEHYKNGFFNVEQIKFTRNGGQKLIALWRGNIFSL